MDCVLLGRPNVGKSTLLNLLAGFDRAIVTPVAGTTRDIVEQAVQLGEIRLNLFDTAGVREVGADGDAIEAEGIRRSWKKLDEAGLVLAVFDAAQPLDEADLDIARRCQGRPALAILNKQDLAADPPRPPRQPLTPYFKKVLTLCAKDTASLQPLSAAVADLLGTAKLDPRAGQLCSARQLAAATRARDAVAEALRRRGRGLRPRRGGGLPRPTRCRPSATSPARTPPTPPSTRSSRPSVWASKRRGPPCKKC